MNIEDVKVGDVVTVSGVVVSIESGIICVETKTTGTRIWIDPEDIKTHRPISN